MEAPRVRIGRGRMKDGGAPIYLIHSEKAPLIVERIRSWADDATRFGAPDAFAAVAFWYSEDMPGTPWICTAFHAAHSAFPTRLLGPLASETVRGAIEDSITEGVIMRRLGYLTEPEDAGPNYSPYKELADE